MADKDIEEGLKYVYYGPWKVEITTLEEEKRFLIGETGGTKVYGRKNSDVLEIYHNDWKIGSIDL